MVKQNVYCLAASLPEMYYANVSVGVSLNRKLIIHNTVYSSCIEAQRRWQAKKLHLWWRQAKDRLVYITGFTYRVSVVINGSSLTGGLTDGLSFVYCWNPHHIGYTPHSDCSVGFSASPPTISHKHSAQIQHAHCPATSHASRINTTPYELFICGLVCCVTWVSCNKTACSLGFSLWRHNIFNVLGRFKWLKYVCINLRREFIIDYTRWADKA
jgi:hypothetical protein